MGEGARASGLALVWVVPEPPQPPRLVVASVATVVPMALRTNLRVVMQASMATEVAP